MTTLVSNINAPIQPIYVLVEYERRNGDITYPVKKVFAVEHGNIEEGLKEIDSKMFDNFNYWESESYENRDMGDYADLKEPLKGFWISHDEIMSYKGSQIIQKDEFDVLFKYL